MSLEVIKQVAAAEAESLAKVNAAKDQMRLLLEDADKNCQMFRSNERDEVLKENRIKLEQAELRAKSRSDEILKTARAQADALKNAAAQHIEEAADLIIERIRA